MLITGAPVTMDFDPDDGVIAIDSSAAVAKGGNSGKGSGDDDDDDGGGSGSGDDDDDSGGSGSGDDDDDNSGSGSGDDDDDDSGGSGSGDDDSSGSGSGDDDSSGSGSGDDDDNSGPGSGDDDNSGPGSGDDDNSGPGSGDDDGTGAKVEIEGDNIEVTFADGTREEIEDGRFERKNAAGRTVEERPATQADRDRLAAAAADTGGQTGTSDVSRVDIDGDDIEVTFADGTKEEIEDGRFQRKNSVGRTVEERPATQADRDRLAAAADTGGQTGTSDVSKVDVTGDNIEVTYSNGWKEEIEAGRYELKDPNGNTVIERAATGADRDRLEQLISG